MNEVPRTVTLAIATVVFLAVAPAAHDATFYAASDGIDGGPQEQPTPFATVHGFFAKDK